MANEDTEPGKPTPPAHDAAAVLSWQKSDKERRSKSKRRGTTVQERLGWKQAETEQKQRKGKHPAGQAGRSGYAGIKLTGNRVKVPGRG